MNQRIRLIVLAFTLALPFVFASESQAARLSKSAASALCAQVKSSARPGDLLFIAIDNFLYKRVAASTLTWASHVGVILPDETGALVVYEATLPVSKRTPLCKFVARADDGQLALRRLRGGQLRHEIIQGMVRAAETRLGILYHLGFDYDSPRQYCSKFVYQVYLEATGLEVGRMQTVQDLIDENPNQELLSFWRMWFLGSIPNQRRLVTPATQLNDAKFTTVFASGV